MNRARSFDYEMAMADDRRNTPIPQLAPAGRVCARPACTAILRRTNEGPLCSPCAETEHRRHLDERHQLANREERLEAILVALSHGPASVHVICTMLGMHDNKHARVDVMDLVAAGKVERAGKYGGESRYRLAVPRQDAE